MTEDLEDESSPVELNVQPPYAGRPSGAPDSARHAGWEEWMRLDVTGVYEKHLRRAEEERYDHRYDY